MLSTKTDTNCYQRLENIGGGAPVILEKDSKEERAMTHSKQTVEEALAYVDNGLRYTEIAEALGISPSRISWWKKKEMALPSLAVQ